MVELSLNEGPFLIRVLRFVPSLLTLIHIAKDIGILVYIIYIHEHGRHFTDTKLKNKGITSTDHLGIVFQSCIAKMT